MGWIGIDLDGTLAREADIITIGLPVSRMVDQVKLMLATGQDVRIFTARVGPVSEQEAYEILKTVTLEHWGNAGLKPPREWEYPVTCETEWLTYQTHLIQAWCREHLGVVLPITATKDFHMIQVWDDRCVQVITNTGETLEGRLREIEILSHIGGDHP